MIEISQAAISDIPLIQQIAQQTWPATFSTIISKGKMNYMLEMMYSIQSLTEQVEKMGIVSFWQKTTKNVLALHLMN